MFNYKSCLMMVLITLIGVTSAQAVSSKAQPMVLKLDTIKVQKVTEQGGDELYFNVTYYSSLGKSRTERIPAEPAHWLSKYLDKIRDITLWEGEVHDQEEIKIVLSLVEQEFPPWDPDELIGGAQLILKNQKGKVGYEWVAPILDEESEIELKPADPLQKSRVFLFKSETAVYEVTFVLQERGV